MVPVHQFGFYIGLKFPVLAVSGGRMLKFNILTPKRSSAI